MEHIGIDVHKRESQLCIIDAALGEVTEKRIRTERGRFKEVDLNETAAKALLTYPQTDSTRLDSDITHVQGVTHDTS